MKKLMKIFKKNKKEYKIQSFTFYLPSPPARSTGYREKQFDKIFYQFINRGYKILHFRTQQSRSENQSGMWLILILQATNPESEKLLLDEHHNESFSKENEDQDLVEGLYYIEDDEN